MCAKYYELRCMLKKIHLVNVSACLKRQNWRYFSASGLKDEKLIKKANLHENTNMQTLF